MKKAISGIVFVNAILCASPAAMAEMPTFAEKMINEHGHLVVAQRPYQ